jgi:hypothetical protein
VTNSLPSGGYPAGVAMPGSVPGGTAGYGSAGYGYGPVGSYFPVPPTTYSALGGSAAVPMNRPVPPTMPMNVGPNAVVGGSPAAGYGTPTVGAGPSPMAAAVGEKPFSNYTPPPVYSPYMNLFRNDNDRGRINNYYNLVRPMVEQQNLNYQTQNRLQSLQSTTRQQGSQLQQIDQRVMPSSPFGSNPNFMNTGQFYPGLNR